MEPQPRLAIVGSIQQAITSLLTTYEPEFLRFSTATSRRSERAAGWFAGFCSMTQTRSR